MFSSLASYLFGSNTTDTNSAGEGPETKTSGVEEIHDYEHSVDVDNLIEVTSQTPSVTGVVAGDRGSSVGAAAVAASNSAIKRGKNKRNNARQQNKRRGAKNHSPSKSGEQITCKQSTPGASCDEDFDEDEWYIVEKEEDFDVSPSRKDSSGSSKDSAASTIEIVKSVRPSNVARSHLTQQRPLQHINSHSLYSGPRPQKQRNYLQKSRNNNSNPNQNTRLSVSTLSPSRIVNDGGRPIGGAPSTGLTADGGMTRSLYAAPSVVTPTKVQVNTLKIIDGLENGIGKQMDDSWFVTPPPCFTSIGPINMETSPYENLLIEHPSMSVYHSIKTAQEAVECFVKLDLDVKEKKEEERPAKENIPRKTSQAVQQRSSAGYRLDRQSVAQMKQELMARTVQMTQSKRERKDIRRSSINRANKARQVQSRNHTSRRSDRQQCKVVSGANNNRKCCF